MRKEWSVIVREAKVLHGHRRQKDEAEGCEGGVGCNGQRG